MFFPELSGIIQPLSGEYAGRRSALENLPFYTGYGVETGLMLDLLENYGLSSLAQSDLQKRVHHNQPLPSLSKMSFAIVQVFLSRIDKRYRSALLPKASLKMNLIKYDLGHYHLDSEEIYEIERPAMNTIPEYVGQHYPSKTKEDNKLTAESDYFTEKGTV
jgi:glucosyl-3-phosphoglycerate synthase